MTTKLYTSEEINAVFNANINKNLFFNKVAIDSREVSNRGIFFAIKGENDDGHRYVKAVLKNKNNLSITSKGPKNQRSIRTKNTLENLVITPHIGGMSKAAQKIAYNRAVDLLENNFILIIALLIELYSKDRKRIKLSFIILICTKFVRYENKLTLHHGKTQEVSTPS